MNAEWLSDLAAKHHVLPVLVMFFMAQRLIRPFFVTVRESSVELVAVARALAKKHGGLTDAEIAEERDDAERVVPQIPEDAGFLAKVLGVTGAMNDRKSA